MSNTSGQIVNEIEGTKYMSEICSQSPYLVLRTQCGTGKYIFQNFSYRNEGLILEFKLVRDEKYDDTDNISYNIGEMCYLTASQFLYAYDYQAYA